MGKNTVRLQTLRTNDQVLVETPPTVPVRDESEMVESEMPLPPDRTEEGSEYFEDIEDSRPPAPLSSFGANTLDVLADVKNDVTVLEEDEEEEDVEDDEVHPVPIVP